MLETSTKVYVEKITNLDLTAESILDKLTLPKKLGKIAIKLNLCEYRGPETGAVTDPEVLCSILKAFRKSYPNAVISLFENNATSVNADRMFIYLGIDKIAQDYSAQVINLAHEKWVEKKIDGYIAKTVEVPAFLDDYDLLVTHPKLKTNSSVKITCGLKNMFGCYKAKRKIIFHKYLDEAIVDINLALKPHVSIVDANVCMEGIGGPCYGVPRKLGMMIGGKDVVAVDAFCASLIGFRPWFVGHIRKAAAKNLGQMHYELSDCSQINNKKTCRFEFDRGLYYLLKLARRAGGSA